MWEGSPGKPCSAELQNTSAADFFRIMFFFLSCLDSQLFFWLPLSRGIYNLNVPKIKPTLFQICYFRSELNQSQFLRLSADARLMVITAFIMLEVNIMEY